MTKDEESKLVSKIVRSEWSQILTVLLAVIGMFFWSVSMMNSSIEAARQDMKDSQAMTNATVESIRQDIKDFHRILCTLEEQYYQIRVNNDQT
jgi:hypothetical protein